MADVAERTDLYETDEHAWIESQVAALRNGAYSGLDTDNLIEFLTSMALRDERELESRLIVLYSHIVKMQIQPDRTTRSWKLTIAEQQRAIRRLLKKLPSLSARADSIMRDILPDAFATALEEMGAGGDFAITGTTFEYAMGFDPWVVS